MKVLACICCGRPQHVDPAVERVWCERCTTHTTPCGTAQSYNPLNGVHGYQQYACEFFGCVVF
jgi:hypothetical protein